MNILQRFVLLVFLGAFVATGVYVPWKQVKKVQGVEYSIPKGFGLYLDLPKTDAKQPLQIDWERLLLQWAVLGVGALTLCFIFKGRD
jgi:hypothetical protein